MRNVQEIREKVERELEYTIEKYIEYSIKKLEEDYYLDICIGDEEEDEDFYSFEINGTKSEAVEEMKNKIIDMIIEDRIEDKIEIMNIHEGFYIDLKSVDPEGYAYNTTAGLQWEKCSYGTLFEAINEIREFVK